MTSPICHSLEELRHLLSGRPMVATVGSFDGVHLGHRRVIDETAREARRGDRMAVLITFDSHPSAVLRGGAPPLITDTEEKLRYLTQCEVDAILLLPFTPLLASQTMRDFVLPLRDRAGLVSMVLGYDSRFGSDSYADPVDLFDQRMAALGVPVRRVPPLSIAGAEVSSSRIRCLLGAGELPQAEALLGHPYSLSGVVIAGRQIGRTIGYPTANILPDSGAPLIPRDAVFVAEVVRRGVTHPAMLYYGTSPTLTPEERDYRLEAYLMDFAGDLYGERVSLRPRLLLRRDRRFGSLDELTAQLARDEERTRDYFRGRETL